MVGFIAGLSLAFGLGYQVNREWEGKQENPKGFYEIKQDIGRSVSISFIHASGLDNGLNPGGQDVGIFVIKKEIQIDF